MKSAGLFAILASCAASAWAAPLNPAAYAPLGAPAFTAGTYYVETSTTNAAPTISGSGMATITGTFAVVASGTVAVFDFTSLDIPAGAVVRGVNDSASSPFALLSQGNLTVEGVVSANGGNGSGSAGQMSSPGGNGGAAGPGGGGGGGGGSGNGAGSGGEGLFPGNNGVGVSGGAGGGPGGGGAGASSGESGGGGGFGGAGSAGTGGQGGGAYGNLLTQLQGGSGGGAGSAVTAGGGGGGGGGGIELAAIGTVSISGTISANGGSGGDVNSGGGSGGGILIAGAAVDLTGSGLQLSAAGGNGSAGGAGGGGGRITITAGSLLGNVAGTTVAGGRSNGGIGSDAASGAGIFVVTDNSDSSSDTGSLRYALANAPAGGTIAFAPSVTGTITLSSSNGVLNVNQSVSIAGPAANVLAVSGNHASGVFSIRQGTTVAISGLTIENGSANGGGGIYNEGALYVNYCTVSGNLAGNAGGGGLFNLGQVQIGNSTVSGNSTSTNGGGICNFAYNFPIIATVQISNSTLSGNSAIHGGGIYNSGGFQAPATVQISNSTLSGNSASNAGGAICNLGGGAARIGNTILATGSNGANIYNGGGTIISAGYNLSDDDGGGSLTGANDRINTNPLLGPLQDNGGPTFTCAPLPGSPALDQGNRNTIPALSSNVDQRGDIRPLSLGLTEPNGGDGSDIGAVEVQAVTTVTTGTVTGINDTEATLSGTLTSNAAATVAFRYSSSDSTLSTGVATTSGQVIAGGTTSMVVTQALSGLAQNTTYYWQVTASNSAGVTATSPISNFTTTNVAPPVVTLNGSNQVILPENGTFTDPGVTTSGSAVVTGTVGAMPGVYPITYTVTDQYGNSTSVTRTVIVPNIVLDNSDNAADPDSLRYQLGVAPAGGAVAFDPSVTGTITLSGSSLNIGQNVTIIGPGAKVLAVSGNHASGVFNISVNATATISGLTIENGSAQFGGGILNEGSLILSYCTVAGNSSIGAGGGIAIDFQGETGAVQLSYCTLSGNSSFRGGGLSILLGPPVAAVTVEISNCTLSGNSASSEGGGIYEDINSFATVGISNSTLSGNSAAGEGGGIYSVNDTFQASAIVEIGNSTFSGNSATNGSGIFNDFASGICNIEIGNTILNSGSSGANIDNAGNGAITSAGYNLSDDAAGGSLTGTNDQINTSPLLGPLQDNGGPTFTCALLPGSPAIDQGNRNTIAALDSDIDQRGDTRPVSLGLAEPKGGDGSDIGAYETQTATVVAVGGGTPTSDSGATLTGTVSTYGPAASVTFEYSTDPTFSAGVATSVAQIVAGGTGNAVVSQPVTGLDAGATYYFEITGSNAAGVVTNGTSSFTQPLPPTGPGTLQQVTLSGSGTVTVTGSDPQGLPLILTATGGPNVKITGTNGNQLSYVILNPNLPEVETISYALTDKDNGQSTGTIEVATYGAVAGTYNGLAQPVGNLPGAQGNSVSGLLRMIPTKKGLFTASLNMGGTTYRLNGHFDNAGNALFGPGAGTASKALTGTGQNALMLALKLEVGYDAIDGTLSLGGSAAGTVNADRALYTSNPHPPAPYLNVPAGIAGMYTMVIDNPHHQHDPKSATPQGDGVATVLVRADGTVTMVGYLADGTYFDYTNSLSKGNAWPFYIPLDGGKGSFSVQLQLEDLPASDFDGPNDANWYLPVQASRKLYPDGWPDGLQVRVIGSKWVVPAPAGSRSVLDAPATGPDGNAEFYYSSAAVSGRDAVNISNHTQIEEIAPRIDRLTLSLDTPPIYLKEGSNTVIIGHLAFDGLFTGSFVDPMTRTVVPVHGAIFQKQNFGCGFFIGGGESGEVILSPDDIP